MPGTSIAGDPDVRRAFRTHGRGAHAADLRRRGLVDDVFVDQAVAVIVNAIAGFRGTDVRARVFTRVVVIEVVVAVLAALKHALTGHASPHGEDGAGVAVVSAHAAVCHVRLQVGLSREHTVAVRIDATSIDRAGWSNGTLAGLHARCALEGASFAG